MSLGESNVNVVAGGGQSRTSSATIARAMVQLNVSPGGAVNTLYKISNAAGAQAAFDSGPLAEEVALCVRTGQTRYAMPLNPSIAGAVGAVTHTGTGAGTIAVAVGPHKPIRVKVVAGGTLGTASFKFSLDGGLTWSATYTSTAGPYAVRVPGTFTTLTFAAATYVADKTLTAAVDGTVTPGTGWVGSVTQASSPIDNYEVVLTVVKGGAAGIATLAVSLDNGNSSEPQLLIPGSGTLVLNGTGLVLTATGSFDATDTYAFLTVCPGFSTTDVNDALTALRALRSFQATMIHVGGLPASSTGAFSAAATVDAALVAALNSDQLDWQGVVECPTAASASPAVIGDIVLSGGAAIRNTADTDTVVAAARGTDLNRTSMFAGTYRIVSVLNSRKLLRPLGWALAMVYVDTDPKDDPAKVALGPLPIYVPPGALNPGRDEAATPGLDDVQINTVRTYRNRGLNCYLSITSSGSGWKNLTTQADFQRASAVRLLDTAVLALRAVGQGFLGQDAVTNADGTIEEKQARAWDTIVDGAFKRSLGMVPGGDFTVPQASRATASISRGSQLGQAPKRLDIQYTLQPKGFVSNVQSSVLFSGVISVTQ